MTLFLKVYKNFFPEHYKYTPFFHKNKEAFYNQKYRDELKRRMCKDNGIYLIEIPNTVKLEDIEHFLTNNYSNYLIITYLSRSRY